jgi:hypothetical protein
MILVWYYLYTVQFFLYQYIVHTSAFLTFVLVFIRGCICTSVELSRFFCNHEDFRKIHDTSIRQAEEEEEEAEEDLCLESTKPIFKAHYY